MNIAIVGTGVIGTFWGYALQQRGHHVCHLVRADPSAASLPKSVKLGFTDRRPVKQKAKAYAYALETDWTTLTAVEAIIVPVKHTQWQSAVSALLPYLSDKTTVVLSGNIWEEDYQWLNEYLSGRCLFAFPHFGGAIVNGTLKGWLTAHMSLGHGKVLGPAIEPIRNLFTGAGFSPVVQPDMRGWLLTHFAWNAGILTQALQDGGFRHMTRSWPSLTTAYRRVREAMRVAQACGVPVRRFPEGRKAFQPLWWNALQTFLLFLLPGMAQGADANRDEEEWAAFGEKVAATARKHSSMQQPIP